MGSEKTAGMFNFDEVCALGGKIDIERRANDAGERNRLAFTQFQPDCAINMQGYYQFGTTGNPQRRDPFSHFNILNNGLQVGAGSEDSKRFGASTGGETSKPPEMNLISGVEGSLHSGKTLRYIRAF